GEGGHVALDGRVEVEAALLAELQDGGGGHGLRDGGQAVHGGGRGRHRVLDVGQAEAGRPAQLTVHDQRRRHARYAQTHLGGRDGGVDGGGLAPRQAREAGRDRGGRERSDGRGRR